MDFKNVVLSCSNVKLASGNLDQNLISFQL